MQELIDLYGKRVSDFTKTREQLQAKHTRFAFVRLGVFVLAVIVILYVGLELSILAAALLAFLFLFFFYRFVMWHQDLLHQKLHYENLVTINQNEISFLKDDYSMFGNGDAFVNPNHPYTVDLDIFGDYSVFQYYNRTSTVIGRQQLAAYFETPASLEEILRRQKAVAELKDKLDWRQDFQASGTLVKDEYKHVLALKEWMTQKPFVLGNKTLELAMYLVPLIGLIGIVLVFLYLPWQALFLFFLPAAYLLRKTLENVNRTAHQTGSAENILAHYGDLMHYIEKEDFHAEKLKSLSASFKNSAFSASKTIKRLSYIIGQLNVRNNIFAIFLNILGLWDLHWVYRLEKWKHDHKDLLPAWFLGLQEFEALSSIATVHYNNPDWVNPVLSTDNEVIGDNLSHPLIPRAKRIDNDIDIPTKGHIKLVTGSNMAGKSTLLRTVGLNIVLAMIGSPVCAKRLQLPLLKVYTSMRTQDALHESTSSFYAELKRLKFIIEAVDNGDNIFFLMDEILKGTNSNDRHTGSKALIKQLIKSKGSGIIATHDLELGALEASYGGAIENLCMEVGIENDELTFDYKIKKGVSKSFNATILMKNMGIRIGE